MPRRHGPRHPSGAAVRRSSVRRLSTDRARTLPNKSAWRQESAKKINGTGRVAPDTEARWALSMSNSFAEFVARLHNQDNAAAQELFVRFAQQLIALANRNVSTGLRHKVDPEDVV